MLPGELIVLLKQVQLSLARRTVIELFPVGTDHNPLHNDYFVCISRTQIHQCSALRGTVGDGWHCGRHDGQILPGRAVPINSIMGCCTTGGCLTLALVD